VEIKMVGYIKLPSACKWFSLLQGALTIPAESGKGFE
jgi:hypothetical protein